MLWLTVWLYISPAWRLQLGGEPLLPHINRQLLHQIIHNINAALNQQTLLSFPWQRETFRQFAVMSARKAEASGFVACCYVSCSLSRAKAIIEKKGGWFCWNYGHLHAQENCNITTVGFILSCSLFSVTFLSSSWTNLLSCCRRLWGLLLIAALHK